MMARIIIGRTFHHPDQQGDLLGRQFLQGGTEIKLTGKTEAMNGPLAILAEIDLVHIGFQDFIFRVMQLQQHGHYRFIELAPQGALVVEKEILHQLLRQGAAPLNNLAMAQIGPQGAGDGAGIQAPMGVEMTILDRQQTLAQQQRHLGQLYQDAIFMMGRIDAADHYRFHPQQGQRRAVGRRKRRDGVPAEVDIHRHRFFAVVPELKGAGGDTHIIAMPLITARSLRSDHGLIIQHAQLTLELPGREPEPDVQFQGLRIDIGRQRPPFTFEFHADDMIEIKRVGHGQAEQQ